ncbi:MAG: hypothetical protein QXQ38_07215, partial [Archaeoglobaceae archaeon]
MIEKRSSESSCQEGSCLAFDYQVEIKEIYNYSNNGKKLTFSEVKVYNESSSFDFKVLSYFAICGVIENTDAILEQINFVFMRDAAEV